MTKQIECQTRNFPNVFHTIRFTFPFVVDGKKIQKKKILFLIPSFVVVVVVDRTISTFWSLLLYVLLLLSISIRALLLLLLQAKIVTFRVCVYNASDSDERVLFSFNLAIIYRFLCHCDGITDDSCLVWIVFVFAELIIPMGRRRAIEFYLSKIDCVSIDCYDLLFSLHS